MDTLEKIFLADAHLMKTCRSEPYLQIFDYRGYILSRFDYDRLHADERKFIDADVIKPYDIN